MLVKRLIVRRLIAAEGWRNAFFFQRVGDGFRFGVAGFLVVAVELELLDHRAQADAQFAVGLIGVEGNGREGENAVIVAAGEGFQPGVVALVAHGEGAEGTMQRADREQAITAVAVGDVEAAADADEISSGIWWGIGGRLGIHEGSPVAKENGEPPHGKIPRAGGS